MENQTETLKVYKHHQHARVQKEGEDMWISSEDLRTEGSSDEEAPGGSRGRRTKKNRKQRKSDLLDSSKSSSSLASASSHSTESSTKDLRGCAGEIEKSTIETNIDMNTERFSVLNNPFFTDVFPESAAGTSGISLGSSDSGMDALNLESRWRPKRGSLKYPILVEGQTTSNYLHEMDGFFTEMMLKIKSLRSCPALDNLGIMEFEANESKLLKHLKNTPAVKKKLKYIERLDNEIKETMQIYKTERAERLQIQNEMCNEICKNPFPGKDGQLFLELCHFEVDENINDEEKGNIEVIEKTVSANQSNNNVTGKFIKRNVELASQGSMASCSLTDEEKRKLEELLVDEQDDSYNLEDNPRKKDSGLSLDESDESSDDENYFISNAYTLNSGDNVRLEDINTELEKFTLDEIEKEKGDRQDSWTQPQMEWKDAVLMEQRLKAINAKLDELHSNYESDRVEDIFLSMVRNGTLETELSETGSRYKSSAADTENSQQDGDDV